MAASRHDATPNSQPVIHHVRGLNCKPNRSTVQIRAPQSFLNVSHSARPIGGVSACRRAPGGDSVAGMGALSA